MLVLERKAGEAIIINSNIKIIAIGIKPNNKIVLGIEAPTDIVVDREEIHILKMKDKKL